MASMTTIDLPGRPIVHREEGGPDSGSRAVALLGSWMIGLGIVRVACAVAALAHAWWASGAIASPWRGAFFGANSPASMLIASWPLLLGVALRRTRWPELIKAAALTLLILSVGGVLAAVADASPTGGRSIAIGSFRLPRAAWARPGAVGMAAVLAGVAQLLLESAMAARAVRLALRLPEGGSPGDGRRVASRRSRFGRLAICFAIAFLVLTIRLPSATSALELINQSQWIRDFILRDDFARVHGNRRVALTESEWAGEIRSLQADAERAWTDGRYPAARDAYARLAARLDAIPTETMTRADRGLAAVNLNNASWLLATCPDTSVRNAGEAVRQARRALELVPNDGNTWNTLGVAYFRLGNWDEALNALYRSMELRNEGDSHDWFFLAMIHWKLGRKERARDWFDKAVGWSRVHPRADGELYRIEVEAAEALGLPRPEPRPVQPAPALGPPMPAPFNMRGLRGGRGLPRPADATPRPR